MTRLFIAGHRGMVGSALVRRFAREPGFELLVRDRSQVDLASQSAVGAFLAAERPDVAVIAAARVGGIHANSAYPAEFLHDNLAIASATIHGAWTAGVGRLLFLGSSCIYPKLAAQPMTEDCLLTGPLEPTNEAYAIAKIAGLKLCQYYRRQHGVLYHSVMPTNLYGPGDNYHPRNSHVLPALIRRFHEAKESGAERVAAWGSGAPRREFLHVDDLADACAFILRREDPPDWINVGTGTDVTIRELAEIVAEATGYTGAVSWDASMPDGTPRKLLDVSRMSALGWRARIGLREGIGATYRSFLAERKSGDLRE
ncbi:MAG TPA: GDP-L-fucose synthase [Opitutaceae bacterium]|nr:GDP-L-fucose synthase [Opitutaceae bacterium]